MNYLILTIVAITGVALGVYFARGRQEGNENCVEDKFLKKENKILGFLRENGEVRNRNIEELFGVSDATVTRHLDILEEKNFILQKGG